MSGFDFLKTGFGVGDENAAMETARQQFVTSAQNILILFAEDALRSAARYVESTGRCRVTKRDMKMGLQYEAIHFFSKPNLEERVMAVAAEEDEEEEEDDDDEEEDEDDGEEDEGEGDDDDEGDDEDDDDEGEDDDEDAVKALPEEERNFCYEMRRVSATWHEWNPTDEAQLLCKRAIDAIP